jgi:mRNA interferase MazF
MAATRGRVYLADLGHGPHYFLCVSRNDRNRHFGSFLAVRLTSRDKPVLPSIVALGSDDGEFAAGGALCDDLVEVFDDEVIKDAGSVSGRSMHRVNDGLRFALSIP